MLGKSSPNGRTIQVNEILQFTQIDVVIDVPPEEKLKQAYIPNSASSNEVHKWHAFCLWHPPEPLSE